MGTQHLSILTQISIPLEIRPMVKLLRIGLVALYVVLTTGVHLHAHACCSDESVLSLVTFSDSCCDSGQGDGACCSGCSCDAVLDFRLEDEHLAGQTDLVKSLGSFTSPAVFRRASENSELKATLSSISDDAPPPKLKRYCLYCALIVYG